MGQVPVSKRRVLTSILTRPNNTSAYVQNNLIASSATAGSIVVPGFTMDDDTAGIIRVRRAILYTNLTTGFTTFQGHIDLWNAVAPTFTNGDRGAYAVATGSANWVGHLTSEVSNAYLAMGDGAALSCVGGPVNADNYSREPFVFQRNRGDVLYWSLREIDSTGFTPIANQTFTLALQIEQCLP